MAKKLYIGVSNVARKVTAAYIGVSNVARKVTKAYIGVNNVAQLFYESKKPDEELTFTSSQTWTVPADAKTIDIFVVGGGGGAGGSFYREVGDMSPGTSTTWTSVYGASGGSGYTQTRLAESVTPGESLSIVVGAGGSGGKTYKYINGSTSGGDVSAQNSMTSGGDGGESYVARNGVKIATASGGKGGTKANPTSSSSGYYNGVIGANGGNASGAGGAYVENLQINSQGQGTQNIIYTYCEHNEWDPQPNRPYGTNGTEGGDGGYVDKWFINAISGTQTKQTNNAYRGGTGQGSNTRKYGDASGTVYATVATTVSANTGNSGALGMSAYTNKAGSSGVVIITVHY